jgi:hypothetical protein
MRLEDPSLLDSLESRFSIDFQQIVVDFVITFCRHPWLVTFCTFQAVICTFQAVICTFQAVICTFQAVICTFQSVIGPLKSCPEAGAVGGRPFSRLGLLGNTVNVIGNQDVSRIEWLDAISRSR